MKLYRVCVAETCYTDYMVAAESPEQARELQGARPKLWDPETGIPWAEAGYGDDPLVVAVEEIK